MTADQGYIRGRPIGCFGFCSCGSFFGQTHSLGSGPVTGIDNPRASSSSNTLVMVCIQQPSSVCGFSGDLTIRVPCRAQIVHQIFVRHLVQKVGFPHFGDHPTCSNCSNKADELGSYKGKVSLCICLVETLVVFVLAEDELQHPALIITKISRFRIHFQIQIEHNDTEDTAFVLILAAREVLVLPTVAR